MEAGRSYGLKSLAKVIKSNLVPSGSGISPANYRQRLSRARRQLYAFLRGTCGLADPSNPCRCPRKTRAAIERGIVNPATLRFVDGAVERVRQGVV